MGKEIEVDAVCDGEDILIPGIMEHIERAGIHSGDSISVYPAQTSARKQKTPLRVHTSSGKALHVIGMINIQFIVCGEDVYVIEVNPRSSRTVPYISKVTGIPIVPLATKVILGHKPRAMATSLVFRQRQNISQSRCRYSPSRRSAAQISALDRR